MGTSPVNPTQALALGALGVSGLELMQKAGRPEGQISPLSNNVGIAIINHPFFDGFYHPFMVIGGMVYYCYTHINSDIGGPCGFSRPQVDETSRHLSEMSTLQKSSSYSQKIDPSCQTTRAIEGHHGCLVLAHYWPLLNLLTCTIRRHCVCGIAKFVMHRNNQGEWGCAGFF